MESTEKIEDRLLRVDMHENFLSRITVAMENKNFIEASWLIYSCFENRYFRTVQKLREDCKYCRSKSKCNHKQSNDLALATKIKCIKRLYEQDVPCIKKAFNYEVFEDTLKWIDKRNKLMHDLLSLEYYMDTDEKFKFSAETGLEILLDTYRCCTEFRKLFYDEDYKFVFPEEAMEGCSCKPLNKTEA